MSGKAKWTPGQWAADGECVFALDLGTIATVSRVMRAHSANATLMAAAPELAEALTQAWETLDTIMRDPKATVRPGFWQPGGEGYEAMQGAQSALRKAGAGE